MTNLLAANIPGIQIERKKFSITTLYRKVGKSRVQMVENFGDDVPDEDAFRMLQAEGVGVVVKNDDACE